MKIDLLRNLSPELVQPQYKMLMNMHMHYENSIKNKRFQVASAFRLLPFIFVGIFTALAGITLAMKVSAGLVLAVGVSSAAILVSVIFFLVRKMKKVRSDSHLE